MAPFAVPPDAGETYIVSPLAPGEAGGLTLEKAALATRLEWSATDRALAYDVYRNDVGVMIARGGFATSQGTPVVCDTAADTDHDGRPDASEPATPGPGCAYAYVVTGRNDQGESPLAPAGAIPARINDAPCP